VRLLADLAEIEGSFSHAVPAGLLRVNLQPTLARFFVAPALPAFLERYPGIELQISEGDRLVDLVREGVDCVLRAGHLQDSSMIAQQVAQLEQVTCASPAYLDRRGRPGTLDGLAGHRAVNFISSATGRSYPFEFAVDGEIVRTTLKSTVSVTGADMYAEAAIVGLGLVQVPRYRVEADLTGGVLEEVLPALPPPRLPVSVLYPQKRQLSPRVRVFADWLRQVFAAPPARKAA
jgi:DNA-binding transcriptional LysR family regulator